MHVSILTIGFIKCHSQIVVIQVDIAVGVDYSGTWGCHHGRSGIEDSESGKDGDLHDADG